MVHQTYTHVKHTRIQYRADTAIQHCITAIFQRPLYTSLLVDLKITYGIPKIPVRYTRQACTNTVQSRQPLSIVHCTIFQCPLYTSLLVHLKITWWLQDRQPSCTKQHLTLSCAWDGMHYTVTSKQPYTKTKTKNPAFMTKISPISLQKSTIPLMWKALFWGPQTCRTQQNCTRKSTV